ncbi:hypothetical protein FV233_18575 [Methylobacterium sp. WL7]|nr:hypothetical protein FV233_18575 [Methylobacterium sp. WL7]
MRVVDARVPPGVPKTIKVSRNAGGNIELHLATIYPPSMTAAAFKAACQEWPTHEITLRDRANAGAAAGQRRRAKVRRISLTP